MSWGIDGVKVLHALRVGHEGVLGERLLPDCADEAERGVEYQGPLLRLFDVECCVTQCNRSSLSCEATTSPNDREVYAPYEESCRDEVSR